LLGLAEDAVRKALAAGAEDAEAYVWDAADLQASVLGGRASTKESRTSGVGVRALKGGAVAFMAAAPAASDAAARAAGGAARFAGLLPPGKASLPEPSRKTPGPGPRYDTALAALAPDAAARAVAALVREARGAGGRGALVFARASLQRSRWRFAVASSRGVQVQDRGVRASLEVECRVRAGAQERTGLSTRAGRTAIGVRGAGREARERAEAMLGARQQAKGVEDVVLDAEAAALLTQMVMTALAGTTVAQGRTVLAGKLGEPVGSAALTIRDGPGCGGPRAARWDDEGTAARDLTLLDRGVVRGYLLDHASAAKLNMPRTGHGLRGDEERFRQAPTALPMGLRVEPGRGAADDLVAEMGRGVVARWGIMGLASLNHTTGEFSVVAPSAFAVRRGEATHPLRPVTIAGTLQGLLAGVKRCGADVRTHLQGTTPSLWAGGLTLAS
jgi:predicted Zn-dependent protease